MRRNARGSIEDTAIRLHAVAVHLLRRVRQTDTESGISPARLSVLSVLVFGGSRTIGELAAAEQVTAPTMTRLVDGLERDGLARRGGDPSDARVTRVRATPRARRVLEAARQRRVDQVVGLLEAMGAEELAVTERAVTLLEASIARPGPE